MYVGWEGGFLLGWILAWTMFYCFLGKVLTVTDGSQQNLPCVTGNGELKNLNCQKFPCNCQDTQNRKFHKTRDIPLSVICG
jgi:hypothetical protein